MNPVRDHLQYSLTQHPSSVEVNASSNTAVLQLLPAIAVTVATAATAVTAAGPTALHPRLRRRPWRAVAPRRGATASRGGGGGTRRT